MGSLYLILVFALASANGKQIPQASRQNNPNDPQPQSEKMTLAPERGGFWQYPNNFYGGGRPPYYQYPSWGYPGAGCAGSASCASECLPPSSLQRYSNPWLSYYPRGYNYENVDNGNQEPVQDVSIPTDQSAYQMPMPQQPTCQYAQCNGGYYGLPCGMRPSYGYGQGLCRTTGGWPSGYCGSGVFLGSYCEEYQCSNDCMRVGYSGGYCEGKCFCWRPAVPFNDPTIPKAAPAEAEEATKVA